MTLVPIRIDGSQVTCGAYLESGEFMSETWTHTDSNGAGVKPDEASITRYAVEFDLLVAAREAADATAAPADAFVSGSTYVDQTGKTLTAKQAVAAFADAAPDDPDA
jgi:hypothetical protein